MLARSRPQLTKETRSLTRGRCIDVLAPDVSSQCDVMAVMTR